MASVKGSMCKRKQDDEIQGIIDDIGVFDAEAGLQSFPYFLKKLNRNISSKGWNDKLKIEKFPDFLGSCALDRYGQAFDDNKVDTKDWDSFVKS